MTITTDYNKHRRPSHGSGQFNYSNTGSRNQARKDITAAQQLLHEEATQFNPRSIWGNPARNNLFNSGRGRSFDQYQSHFANKNEDNYLKNGSTGTTSRRNWQNTGNNPRSPPVQRQDPQPSRQYQPSRFFTPEISVFRRSSSQESGGLVPYEQQFPRTIDQSSSHAVRLTTKDQSINALSDLCP